MRVVWLRWRLLVLRLKLVVTLLGQVFVTDAWIVTATLELPLAYGLTWLLMPKYLHRVTIFYGCLIVIRTAMRLGSAMRNHLSDAPLFQSLGSFPQLAAFAGEIRRVFGLPPLKKIAFVLSPAPWRTLGCSAGQHRQDQTLAVVCLRCLEIYSVSDLKCELAHAWVRPRSRTLISICAELRKSLFGFSRPSAFRSRPRWQLWAGRIAASYEHNLALWDLWADLIADRTVAGRYGVATVSNWVEKSRLVMISVPAVIHYRVGWLTSEGVLLAFARECNVFHSSLEAEWEISIKGRANRARPDDPALSAFVRKRALEQDCAAGLSMDPRRASSLFENLDQLEEQVIRNEFALGHSIELKRPNAERYADEVVLPLMRKELNRNADLISDWRISELPNLVGRREHLAMAYSTEPGLLLPASHRVPLVEQLFASFLTIELLNIGWQASFSEEAGLIVQYPPRAVRPTHIVNRLVLGDITRDEFIQLLFG